MFDFLWEALNDTQIIILGIALAIAVILFLVFVYVLLLRAFKPEMKAELHRIAVHFKEEKKQIIADKKHADAEIRKSKKEISAQTERAHTAENEFEQMKKELLEQGLRADDAEKIANMTLEELQELKAKSNEGENLGAGSDFIINAVTRKVLMIDTDFERRSDIKHFKVPVNITKEFKSADVKKYIELMSDVKFDKDGVYKVRGKAFSKGKSFAMLTGSGKKFKLTLKCGPNYGQLLTTLYPDFFGKAKFPYGMLWFSADKDADNDCSFELIKVLIAISYNIAKAGY